MSGKRNRNLFVLMSLAAAVFVGVFLIGCAAEANRDWLEGEWKLTFVEGEFVDGDSKDDYDVDVKGSINAIISNVTETKLDFATTGSPTLTIEDDGTPVVEEIMNPDEKDECNYTESGGTYAIVLGTGFNLTVKDLTEKSAYFTFVTTADGDPFEGTLTLEFTAKKDTGGTSSSSGGCNTGAGLGLFLALGALAAVKGSKRKA